MASVKVSDFTAITGANVDLAADLLGMINVDGVGIAQMVKIVPNELIIALRRALDVPTARTTALTLTAALNGKTYTNEGASAEVVFTLPTAVAGYEYTFIVQDADGIKVVAAAGDTIGLAGSVSAVAGNVESVTTGSVLRLKSINATEWIATMILGTWVVT